MKTEHHDAFLSFVQGFLLGGMIGASVALLYAPKPGMETRGDLANRSRDLKEEAEKRYEQALERAIQLKNRAEEQVAILKKQGHEHAMHLKDKAGQRMHLVKEDPPKNAEKKEETDKA
ncbi:MAG: hypothetical protein B6244_14235 [Candidatus Cloacimonetes bacterium 4572_55]|nr:MAG: hypothetical protein B6244_14235 [Candidatus Cloacimonetes bacterium 4572_55]